MLDSHGLIYRSLWTAEERSERFDLGVEASSAQYVTMKIFLKDCPCYCLVVNERKKEKRQSKTKKRKKRSETNIGMELTIFGGKKAGGK